MPSAAPSRPVLPAAVSVLSAALVGGEPVPATVLGVHGPALYLDVAGRVLPIVTSDAVPLPTALRLAVAGGRVAWGVLAGDVVPVGDGRVVLPGLELVVSRTWRPSRVRRVSPTSPARPARPSGVGCSGGRQGSHLSTQLGVDGLLGRGPGLTPSGDDALAGILLVLHALDAAGPLAAAVRARLDATTAVSAALLDAAADGFAAPDVVALVDAALAGDEATVADVLPAVLAMGHTSGRDLVAGIAGSLDCLTHPSPTGRSAA